MKRTVIAILAGLTVTSAVFASAAYLGVESDSLGAGDDTVTACVATVDTHLASAWDATAKSFTVTGVEVSGIDATDCAGQTVAVVLVDADNDELATGTATVDAATEQITLDNAPTVATVANVHVQIAGSTTP